MFEFINNYDLFIFDFDGCIIDTEYVHYKSYKKTLEHFNIEIPFEYDDYVKLFHSCESKFSSFIKLKMDYDEFYKYKSKIFESLIYKIKFIDGATELIELLLQNNKQICVATNSSLKRVNLLKNYFPFLNKIQNWITKDDCIYPKPNPECFLKAIQLFNISNDKIIIFEDSYKGFKSAENIPVDKVLIQIKDYYYYNSISCPNKYYNFFQIQNIVR